MGRKTADHNSSCTVMVFDGALRAMWPNNPGTACRDFNVRCTDTIIKAN